MGWGRSSVNSEALAREWYTKIGIAGMKQLEKFVGARVAELYAAIEKHEQTHESLDIGSDDGMSDVVHHVVGLGEEEFNACLKDPTLIEKRYLNNEYKESFAYCFHKPEPPRTKFQKEVTQQELLQAVADLEKKIQEFDFQLAEIQGLVDRAVLLAGRIKEDKKTA